MPTNTRESCLENLIIDRLTTKNGYEQGASSDYNREYAVDEPRMFRFLETMQQEQMAKLGVCKDGSRTALTGDAEDTE